MEATMVRREEAEMAGELTDARFEEFAARMEERFDRAERVADERFARADEKAEERFAKIEEKGQERYDALAERMEVRFVGLAEQIARVSEKSDQRAVEVDRRLGHLDRGSERLHDRLDSMIRVMIAGNISLTCGVLGGFIAIVALILNHG
jgi:hypothetical protein